MIQAVNQEQDVVESVYHAYGGSAAVFNYRGPECLIAGAGGSGKSRGTAEYFNWLAEEYPGCRLLVVRKARSSLSQSWMVTFEDKVLPPDSPVSQGASRTHRSSYKYPNGSEIVMGGMDQATKLFSTEYDLILVVECTELSESEWEKLHRALRNGVVPWQTLIGECNPDSPYHWLHQRFTSGRLKMFPSVHEDNPSLTKDYLKRLREQLTGVDLQRLYFGRWTSAEGLIWPQYSESTHLIEAKVTQSRTDKCWHLSTSDISGRPTIWLKWFFASVDWGFRDPGVIQVWGVDGNGNAYRVHEVYRTGKDIDWWAEKAETLRKRYDILRFACDPSRPEYIRHFNRYMSERGGYWLGKAEIACKAKNAIAAGLSIVRQRFSNKSLYIVKGTLESPDPNLKEGAPRCFEQEIPSFVYAEDKENHSLQEIPSAGLADHSCDCAKYAMVFLEDHNWDSTPEPDSAYPVNSYGRLMDHDKIFNRSY